MVTSNLGCRDLEVRLVVSGESDVETEHDVVGVCVIEVDLGEIVQPKHLARASRERMSSGVKAADSAELREPPDKEGMVGNVGPQVSSRYWRVSNGKCEAGGKEEPGRSIEELTVIARSQESGEVSVGDRPALTATARKMLATMWNISGTEEQP
jgi:hypothetical protein